MLRMWNARSGLFGTVIGLMLKDASLLRGPCSEHPQQRYCGFASGFAAAQLRKGFG
jgi:hypothetical protein